MIAIDRDVETPMRDGTLLRCDVYRADSRAAAPTLLLRTPYNRRDPSLHTVMFDVLRAVDSGYTVVVQDTRGRHGSDGEFEPFRSEGRDGFDTVEWAARQPWSNGRVGMVGTSYAAYAQWLAALAAPPHLAAIAPRLSPDGVDTNWVYHGGAFQIGFNTSWPLGSLVLDELDRFARRDADRGTARRELVVALDKLAEQLQAHAGAEPLFRALGVAAYVGEWRAHPPRDPWWSEISATARRHEVTVPAFSIGGWYDTFLQGTLANFRDTRDRAGTNTACAGQRLLVGPWLHGAPYLANPVGEADFGVASGGAAIDVVGRTLRFFDRWLRDGNADAEPRVTLFVMGLDEWRDFDDWPPPGATTTRFFLHSRGSAATADGDGALSLEAPNGEPADSFAHDPSRPVETRGGGLCCSPLALRPGVFDQRPVERRPDVLVYTTPVLESDVIAIGPVRVELHASSSASDADFTAKLVDVEPTGYARNIADGILRVRWRSETGDALLVPSVPERIEIDLAGTAHVFRTGHRIRLEISSSNYPRFEPNPISATQTVYHDAGRPSALVLSTLETV